LDQWGAKFGGAVEAGIAAAYVLGLQTHGVQLVGHIPKGVPPLTILIFPSWIDSGLARLVLLS
jgi:hypothetical protein